jgi:hypothetical protein
MSGQQREMRRARSGPGTLVKQAWTGGLPRVVEGTTALDDRAVQAQYAVTSRDV